MQLLSFLGNEYGFRRQKSNGILDDQIVRSLGERHALGWKKRTYCTKFSNLHRFAVNVSQVSRNITTKFRVAIDSSAINPFDVGIVSDAAPQDAKLKPVAKEDEERGEAIVGQSEVRKILHPDRR
jgi:hypothetical protein